MQKMIDEYKDRIKDISNETDMSNYSQRAYTEVFKPIYERVHSLDIWPLVRNSLILGLENSENVNRKIIKKTLVLTIDKITMMTNPTFNLFGWFNNTKLPPSAIISAYRNKNAELNFQADKDNQIYDIDFQDLKIEFMIELKKSNIENIEKVRDKFLKKISSVHQFNIFNSIYNETLEKMQMDKQRKIRKELLANVTDTDIILMVLSGIKWHSIEYGILVVDSMLLKYNSEPKISLILYAFKRELQKQRYPRLVHKILSIKKLRENIHEYFGGEEINLKILLPNISLLMDQYGKSTKIYKLGDTFKLESFKPDKTPEPLQIAQMERILGMITEDHLDLVKQLFPNEEDE